MKKIKNQNSFLFACISCITVLLVMCYFSVDFSFKGTYSATTYSCANGTEPQKFNNTYVCVQNGFHFQHNDLTTRYSCTTSLRENDSNFDSMKKKLLNNGYEEVNSIIGADFLNIYTYSAELTSIDNICIVAAQATDDTYYIYFDTNGGTGFLTSTVRPKIGEDYTIPTDKPVLAGKVFSHWNTEDDGTGMKYYAGNSYRIDKNTFLYAQYTDMKYNIVYDGNGGTVITGLEEKIHDVDYVIMSEKPTRTGYTFKEWNTNKDGSGTSYVAGDIYSTNAILQLFAIWEEEKEIVTSTVSLTEKTATYTGSQIHANTATFYPSSATVVYKYYTDSSCSKETNAPNFGISSSGGGAPFDAGTYYVKASIAATANYTAAESSCVRHTINRKSVAVSWGSTTTFTYNGNNQGPTASVNTGISGETMTVSRTTAQNVGSHTSTATCTTVSGGRASCDNYTLTNNTKTFTINEAEVVTYSVEYDANGGSGAPRTQTKSAGVTLALSSTKPTRTGYTFKNWNTMKDGTGHTYNSGANYTGDANLKLYAQWSINEYSITYDANGGSGAPSSQIKTYGVNITLSSTIPTRNGYIFEGWNTTKDGTGNSYSSGETYNKNADLKLYAQWKTEAVASQTFKATFDANGGTLSGNSSITCSTSTTSCDVTDLPTATKDGYTFTGWGTDSSCTSGEKTKLSLTKNTTYKACYTKNVVVEVPSEDEDGNTNKNPTTGEIAIALTWFVGLVSIGYSFYYFKSVKQN